MKKNILRQTYKQKRLALTSAEIEKYQQNIYKQVFELELENIKKIHIFLSLEKLKEIDTEPIISYFKRKNKQIIISKSDFKTNTLLHFYFDEKTILKKNEYGISEPINGIQVNEKEIDLVFVPLLISDKQCFRVGYGKGFYDRFLANCKKDVLKIGINFFKPINKIMDTNKFDIPLDLVLYPE